MLFGRKKERTPFGAQVLLLLGATITVAICSEFLVDSIEGVTEEYGLPGVGSWLGFWVAMFGWKFKWQKSTILKPCLCSRFGMILPDISSAKLDMICNNWLNHHELLTIQYDWMQYPHNTISFNSVWCFAIQIVLDVQTMSLQKSASRAWIGSHQVPSLGSSCFPSLATPLSTPPRWPWRPRARWKLGGNNFEKKKKNDETCGSVKTIENLLSYVKLLNCKTTIFQSVSYPDLAAKPKF